MKVRINIAGGLYWTVGMLFIIAAGLLALPLLFLRYSWEIADRLYHVIEEYPKYFKVKL